MSILYGFINLDGRPADPAILLNMQSALKLYHCDAQTSLSDGSAAFGFMNQYTTEESRYEKMPLINQDKGLLFIFDGIIDNRTELSSLLNLQITREVPDGRIVFEAYQKWGKDCTKYLLGDFAFVVFDKKRQLVQLFRDHVGKRLLYYRLEHSCVYFSTLIKPLIDPCCHGVKPQLNEEYLVSLLAINNILQDLKAGDTIYQGIHYIFPANCLSVSDNTVINEVYWDPRTIQPDQRLRNSDYIEAFNELFFDAVRCRLRSDGNIGVFLSGGLDSSAVACVAASVLRDQNKFLQTYTSVPHRGYTDWLPRNILGDESSSVKTMQNAYPNMITHFIDCAGKNSLNVADRILEVFEQPYKFIENSVWLDEIFQRAAGDGCRVILAGSFGNSTISYGYIKNILFEHFRRLRIGRFAADLTAFCRRGGISRKLMLKLFTGELFRSFSCNNKRPLATQIINEPYLQKFDIESKLRSIGFTNKMLQPDSNVRRYPFQPNILQQNNSVVSKLGLASNTCQRDPTGDKRVVEFCMKLPYECFIDKTSGLDRGLIRRAMTGIVPESILNNQRFGLQAADWLERIIPSWREFLQAFSEIVHSQDHFTKYLNLSYVDELIHKHSELKYTIDACFDVRNIITIDNCIRFLNMHMI